MLRLVPEMRGQLDREAFGSFILSMTRSVADVLGVYLLAKEAGAFLDAAGTEICPLPIVPLFETIDDLRAAPAIMRELLCSPARPPQHQLAGRRAGSDDRLFRFEQGRRLLRLELGTVEGAVAAHQGEQRDGREDRLLPWPRRLGLPRRRADGPRHRGAAGRLDPRPLPRHRAGRGGLLQICQSRHRRLSDGAARGERVRACAEVRARGRAEAAARDRRRHGGALRRLARRLYAASSAIRTSSPISSRRARSKKSRCSISARARRGASARGASPISAPSPGCSPGRRTGTSSPAGMGSARRSRTSSRCAARRARPCLPACSRIRACSA